MGIRILVIEDEHEIADFVVRGLKEEGFTVERAADGEEGWYQLRTGSRDVVLLDWWLPELDGPGLLRRLRQAGDSTPVLFLTARDAVSDRVRGLDGGASAASGWAVGRQPPRRGLRRPDRGHEPRRRREPVHGALPVPGRRVSKKKLPD
jgi:CheY-like chemotaxis protein